MNIWFDEVPITAANERGLECINGHIGIELLEAGEDWLKARMPVDRRTRQPAGVLHGGASMVLAETLASWGAYFVVDRSRYHVVGQEINANHVRAARDGYVYGIGRPLHLGRTSQVWEVRITDESDRLVCISRVTMAILETAGRY